MASVSEKVFRLIKDTVEKENVDLWDVRYVKEGASYYLRVFIDKQDGVGIEDCTNVSHAIDPILDEEDPISDSYYLEVCSPGIERELVRPEHFEKMMGRKVKVRLFKAIDSVKEFTGILTAYNKDVTVDVNGNMIAFPEKDISKVILCDFEQ